MEASDDVTVHVVSVTDWSTGSYVALPLVELGTDYYVMTHSSTNDSRASWQVCVMALADDTVVRLSRPTRLRPLSVGLDFTNIRLQSNVSVVLDNHQTFQVIRRRHVMTPIYLITVARWSSG